MSIIKYLTAKSYVDIKDFSNIMSNLCLNGELNIAVAVSGGSDSLCLALLFKLWSKYNKAKITAIIVNHKLRDNINAEIHQVCVWLKQYNIDTVILPINEISKNSKLQQNARKERYKVLLKYCEDNNTAYLAIAHHFNDLIETVVMREKRGEDIWGKSGISLVNNFKKVLIIRPLLFFSKIALQNTLINMNQNWVEDPSNRNTKFERVLIRNQLGELDKQQIDYYADLVNRFRINRINLERECLEYLVDECEITKLGEVILRLNTFLKLNYKAQIAVIRLIINFIASKEYMPKIAKVKSLLGDLNKYKTDNIRTYTLGGVLIISKLYKQKNKDIDGEYSTYIKFVKESRNITDKAKINDINNNYVIWDKRFLVNNIKNYPKNYFFAKLNTNEYNKLCEDKVFNKVIKKSSIKRYTLLTLPWLFNEDNKPIAEWVNYLLNEDYVKFSPTNDLLKEIFSHFHLAKVD